MKFTGDNEEYLNLEDLKTRVGMCATVIYEKIRNNKLPKSVKKHVEIKVLRKICFWKKSEVEKYLKNTVE